MADPAGESVDDALRLDLDRRLKREFHGCRITPDAGLLAYRELHVALGLADMACDEVVDPRTGKNRQHVLTGLVRKSVLGRLGGYEDLNNADRLGRDPARRWIVCCRAVAKQAASTSQMGRFETVFLPADENLAVLADLSGESIDRVHARQPSKALVLDMASSIRPTYGDQEGSAYNGHYARTCYHPLFMFNQFTEAAVSVCRNPAADCRTVAAARSSAGVTRPVVMTSRKKYGRGVS